MRRLLYLTSLLALASCGGSEGTEAESVPDTTVHMNANGTLEVIINSDTITYIQVDPARGHTSRAPSDTGRHIQSPNPSELDSIKQSKTKGKQ